MDDTLHPSQTTNQNIPNSHILQAEFLQSLHVTQTFFDKNSMQREQFQQKFPRKTLAEGVENYFYTPNK